MPKDWTRIVMKGEAQVIPPVCPNCLAEGREHLRYGYKGLEGWLTRTTFYQSFHYCPSCLPQARSADGLRRWGWSSLLVAFLGAVAGVIALGEVLKDPVTGVCTPLQADFVVAGGAALGILAGILFYLAARFVKRRRHPRRPDQAVWGMAAYYAGKSRWGLDAHTAVYLAARPEWIAALAKANPDQVDEASCQGITGGTRPEASKSGRPFGPA
ncbi:hypothetical protein [Geothrix alkalitolerans]|uniref:hypothetical protein n=1 Tax=Geothrix alkalitolerans TaxID=2922724 RepID=UPI001FAF1BB6|nr:hypothetical protein [Geothrix alkalitolerans]